MKFIPLLRILVLYNASKFCNLSRNIRKPLKIGGGGGGGGGVTANQAQRKERRIKYKIKKNRKFSHTKVTDQNNSVDNIKHNTMLFI